MKRSREAVVLASRPRIADYVAKTVESTHARTVDFIACVASIVDDYKMTLASARAEQKNVKYIARAVAVESDDNIDALSRELDALCEHVERSNAIAIGVKTLTGSTIIVNSISARHRRVRDLMVCVEEKEGIPVEQQRLIFAGQQLKEERLLSSYNIRSRDTVHLVLRLRGGMYVDANADSPPSRGDHDEPTAQRHRRRALVERALIVLDAIDQ